MNRSRYTTLTLICVASLALGAALPFPAFASSDILGQHIVQTGETLYCIGRGYGVVPSAIAEVNSLSAFTFVFSGQVLKIPAVQWSPIPPGPVCARQFTSPFTGGVVVTLTTTPTAPTATQTPPATLELTYTVKRGDTLFRIGLRFGVTVPALVAANNLTCCVIQPDWVLVIPPRINTPTVTPTTTAIMQELVSLTSPVSLGANATITVRTISGVSCSIMVNYKSGPSQAQGLDPKTAGNDGICSWTWKVGTNTTPGMWSIVVTTGGIARVYAFVVK